MTSFAIYLDQFVRWFFNSSPTHLIEPRQPLDDKDRT